MGEKPRESTSVTRRAFLDGSDFIAALKALKPSDLLLLHKKAKFRALGCGMEGDDLFQEAILRTLEEDGRNCPSDVPVPVYLDNAMRSIADGERTKYVRERSAGIGQPQDGPIAAALDSAPLPSDAALARIDLMEVLESVQQIFATDPQAQAVIIGDMEGWSADEVKDLEDMDGNQYAAARKKGSPRPRRQIRQKRAIMSKSSDARLKLDRLGDALAKDLDTLSADELSEEIAADGDGETTVNHMRNLVDSAIAEGGRRRLARARKAYDAIGGKQRSQVVQLPLNRKKEVVAHFAHSAEALPERLTLAARNEDNSEADLDSLLEDLLELGVIDEKGNPR